MNPIDILIIGLVLALAALALFFHFRRKKKTGSPCGGDCAGCAGCPSANQSGQPQP